jgi:hypothetical protein
MDSPWPSAYGRNALQACTVVALFLLVAFSPFLVGPYSLMAAASDAPSLYAGGARDVHPSARPRKEVDPGAPAWVSEPWLAVQHRAANPWWDPYDGYGQPFAAAQQTQPFFPLTALAALAPSPRAWNWFVVGRLVLAGTFAALFVLWFGGRAAATAGGIATALCGYYTLYYGMPHLSVEVLVPALLWASEWVVRRPGPGSFAAVAAVVGLQVLGGMPESLVLAVLTAGAYVALRLIFERRFGVLTLLPFAGACALGAAIGGVLIVPLLEYLSRSYDTHRTVEVAVGLGGDGLHPLKSLLLQLAPLAYGAPFADLSQGGHGFSGEHGFVGTVAALGALVALVAAFRRAAPPQARAAVLALAAIVAFYALKNQAFPLVNWVGALPVLKLVIFPKYDEALIGVATGLLCGLGVAAVERAWARGRDVATAFALVLVALTAGYAYAIVRIPPGTGSRIFFFACTFALVALLLAAGVLAAPARFARTAFAAVVAAAALGQYYVPVYGFIADVPTVAANPYAPPPYVAALRTRLGGSRERVLSVAEMLAPNWGGALGLDTPNAINALYPSRYLPFVAALLGTPADPLADDRRDRFDGFSVPALDTPLARRWLTLSSVRYVIVPGDRRTHGAGLRSVYDADARIYEYDAPLPRASIFHAVRGVADERRALEALVDPGLDVRRTLILEGVPSAPGAAAAPGESARIAAAGAGEVALDAQLRAPGYVMLNDTAYPGWVAEVDGRATPVLQADDLFRAVAVPAGRHRVTFAYRSSAVSRGILLTVAGLLALAGCTVLAALRRMRRRTAAGAIPARA